MEMHTGKKVSDEVKKKKNAKRNAAKKTRMNTLAKLQSDEEVLGEDDNADEFMKEGKAFTVCHTAYRTIERTSLVGAAHVYIMLCYSGPNHMPTHATRKWIAVGNTYLDVRSMKAGPVQTAVTLGMGMQSSKYRDEVLNWHKETRTEGGATIQPMAYLYKETHNKYARKLAKEVGGFGNLVHIVGTHHFIPLAMALTTKQAAISIYIRHHQLRPYCVAGVGEAIMQDEDDKEEEVEDI